MATRLSPSPVPEPAISAAAPDQPAWTADEGMVIDTILVRSERTSYMTIERPKDWTPKQVTTALNARRDGIAGEAPWWESTPATTIVEVRLGVNEPDTDAKPFPLSDADLASPPEIQVRKD
jgi:hypothetical protein